MSKPGNTAPPVIVNPVRPSTTCAHAALLVRWEPPGMATSKDSNLIVAVCPECDAQFTAMALDVLQVNRLRSIENILSEILYALHNPPGFRP